ncbi:MAG: hypothetical protein COA73_17180 [Candidatus Hydrogenedentota bacterium]|nr:MAG: hypothetical protein COA73_17180 [Candidatus Hydrogenedentota bacterium]
MVKVMEYIKDKPTRLIGSNCPGLLSPASKAKVGIVPGNIVRPGNVGVVSRSGTLTYEAIAQLVQHGMGQSTCVGIGGDPVHGTTFTDVLELFEADDETEAIVLIGEIGGIREQLAADYIKEHVTKPVVAAIAGSSAPAGKRMGHAGAIVGGEDDTAAAKIEKLEAAGIPVAKVISEIVDLVKGKI